MLVTGVTCFMMGRVSINRESGVEADTTAVSNIFIDEYMSEANDAQLKIYLYLLRMMRADLPTSLSDLADRFNLTEKDVTRALKFWEKRGIVSMEYDRSRKLTGIHLEDLASRAHDEIHVASLPAAETPAPAEEPVPSKPRRAAAPVNAAPAAEPEDCSQLIFIAERYLKRPLSEADVRSLLYIHDTLRFSDELIDYLLQYCVERDKRDFRYIERVAVRWQESGYETPSQAKQGSFKYDKRIYEVMDLLGLSNLPTATEAAFIERWMSEYRLSIDVVREACSRTVLATQKRRLEYCDGILTKWHEAGVTKKADIRALDEAYEEQKKARTRVSAPAQNAAQNGRIHNFREERSYDYASLEKKLIRN